MGFVIVFTRVVRTLFSSRDIIPMKDYGPHSHENYILDVVIISLSDLLYFV